MKSNMGSFNCINEGIKREGESCKLNNKCIYPNCKMAKTVNQLKNEFIILLKEKFENEEINGFVVDNQDNKVLITIFTLDNNQPNLDTTTT